MLKIAFLMGLVLMMAACSTKTGPAEAYKDETPRQIFEGAEADMLKGSYSDAIKRFEALEVQYPLEKEAELAEIHLVYAYYRKEDYALAEAAATRFIQVYPTSQHTAYIYLLKGLSDYYQEQGVLDRLFSIDLAKRDLEPLRKAFFDFSALVDNFPNSPYAPAAYQYMVYLRNLMAKHQFQLAQFYNERKAYVATIDRATLLVTHYQGAPVIPEALVLMAQAYQKLHLTQQQQEVIDLLQYNYPDSSYLKEARG